jgi:hypothetical protein
MTTMGPFSWSQDRGDLNVSAVGLDTSDAGSGTTVTGHEIVDGNKTYSTTSVTGLPTGVTLPSSGWTETTWRGHGPGGGMYLLESVMFGLGSPGGGTNPKSILGLLRGRADGEEKLGHAVLDGVATSHFRSSIPFSSLGVPRASTALVERALGSKSLAVDYWTDSSDRLRLMRFSLKISHVPEAKTTQPNTLPPGLLLPMTEFVQLQVSDYGTPVTVTPPPPSEITSRSTCVASASGFSC